MITFNTPKLAKNNTSETLDFSSTNIQADKEIDLLLTEPSPTVVTPDAGYLGISKVTINHPPVEELTEAEITQNGEFHITPSEGYDATLGVTVNVDVAGKPRTLDVTKNGTFVITADDQPISQVTVNASVEEPATSWTDVDGMKYMNSSVTEFPEGLNFAPRTDCLSMFRSCTHLKTVKLFDTSAVKDFGYMFNEDGQLTSVPEFDTSNGENFTYTFENCISLTSVPAFDTSKMKDFTGAFRNCRLLSTLPQFDLSNVTNASNFVVGCQALVSIPKLNLSKVVYPVSFTSCSSLTTLGGFTGISVNVNLSSSPSLTRESLLNVINEAADVSASPKTLTFGSTNLAKLTDEEKAIATNKGWTLA